VLTLVVWTQTSRHEYFAQHEAPERRTGPADDPDEAHWQRIGPWRNEAGHRPSRAFYDYLWSNEGQSANLFLDWALLDGFLRHQGYQARYAFAFPMHSRIPEPAVEFMQQVDGGTVWGGLPPLRGRSFLEMPKGFARGPGGHPLEEGHAWFAATLAAWITA
jgi:hypothetical protein